MSLNRFYFEFRLQNVKIVMGNHFNFLKCSRLFLANKTGIIRCSIYTTNVELKNCLNWWDVKLAEILMFIGVNHSKTEFGWPKSILFPTHIS